MTTVRNRVATQQKLWATAAGFEFDAAGYTLALDDNLVVPLSEDTRAEFAVGDGGELGGDGTRGKMQALHSSSALACNVFEHWRHRDRAPLAEALATGKGISSVRFEQKFATGLRGNKPNLDVVLGLSDDSIVAIESKFLEPYGSPHASGFKPKYFEDPAGEWSRRGLSACQAVAEAIQQGDISFRWLNAEQLLKHALGLANSGGHLALWYAWFDPGSPEGREHAGEADTFAELVREDGIGFRSITYQHLFERLRETCGSEHEEYMRYLGGRYFSVPASGSNGESRV